MRSHRRAVLALAVLVVAAAAARAQDAAPDRPDPALGLKLRLQETLLPPVAPGPEDDLPIFVEADRIQGTQGHDLEADGNVVVRRRGEALFADQLRYSFPTTPSPRPATCASIASATSSPATAPSSTSRPSPATSTSRPTASDSFTPAARPTG